MRGRVQYPRRRGLHRTGKNSVNGVISYNTVSLEQGFTYDNIVFRIEDGKIVEAHSNDDVRINALLDTDEGARYFGEFAIGVNLISIR